MALENLTTQQKVIGAAAIGGLGLMFLMKKGAGGGAGGPSGIAVVDVRRPTDDMNTPGAEWGAGSTMVEITRAYTDLMGRLLPQRGDTVTSPPGTLPPVVKDPITPPVTTPPVPAPNVPPVKPPDPPACRGGHFTGIYKGGGGECWDSFSGIYKGATPSTFGSFSGIYKPGGISGTPAIPAPNSPQMGIEPWLMNPSLGTGSYTNYSSAQSIIQSVFQSVGLR